MDFYEVKNNFKSSSSVRERVSEWVWERERERETRTYSQQGLVVVNVFGGKGGAHADGKWRQWQTRQQASQ